MKAGKWAKLSVDESVASSETAPAERWAEQTVVTRGLRMAGLWVVMKAASLVVWMVVHLAYAWAVC